MANPVKRGGPTSGNFVASWNVVVSGISVDDLIIVGVGGANESGDWTVTDDAGNTYTSRVSDPNSQNDAAGWYKGAIFIARAVSAPTSVTIHDSTSGANGKGTAEVYSAAGWSYTFDEANSEFLTSSSAAPALTSASAAGHAGVLTSGVGDLIFSLCVTFNTAITHGSGHTALDESIAAVATRTMCTQYKIGGTSGSTETVGFASFPASNAVIVAGAIKVLGTQTAKSLDATETFAPVLNRTVGKVLIP